MENQQQILQNTKNCSSELDIFWIDKIIKKGLKFSFNKTNLFKTQDDFKYKTMKQPFKEYVKRLQISNKRFTAWKCYDWCRKYYIKSGIAFSLNNGILEVAIPLIVKQIIKFITDQNSESWRGFFYVGLLSLLLLLRSYLNQIGLINAFKGRMVTKTSLQVILIFFNIF